MNAFSIAHMLNRSAWNIDGVHNPSSILYTGCPKKVYLLKSSLCWNLNALLLCWTHGCVNRIEVMWLISNLTIFMQLYSLIHTIKSNFKFPGVDNLVLNKNRVFHSGLIFQYTLHFTLPWVKHNAQAFKFLYNMKISKGILLGGGTLY